MKGRAAGSTRNWAVERRDQVEGCNVVPRKPMAISRKFARTLDHIRGVAVFVILYVVSRGDAPTG